MIFFESNNKKPFVLDAGSITSTELADNAVTNTKIADNAVTNAKVADNAINTNELVDNAVTNAKMADNAVNTNELVNDAVTNAKIADNAVDTLQIVNNAVTNDKMADNSVNTNEIVDSAVTAAKIASNAVTPNKIGNPTNGMIVNGAWGKINPSSGFGCLAGYFDNYVHASATTRQYRSGSEHGMEWLLGDANIYGGLKPLIANLYTDMDMTIIIRFQLLAINNNEDLWLGLVSDPSGDFTNGDYSDGKHVFMFGKRNGETDWHVLRNNGSTPATYSNNSAYDTNIHNVTITTTSTTLTLQLDSGTVHQFTTIIPSSTTPLALVAIANAESTVDKTFRVLDIHLSYTYKSGL